MGISVNRLTLILIAVLLIFVCTAGCVNVDADDPVYKNNTLTTVIEYSGETRDVWVQNTVYLIDGITSTKIETKVLPFTFTNGQNICEIPFDLPKGEYKVNIYVLGRDENTERIAAIIRNFNVV